MLSELPLTTSLSLYCKQAMPLLWPFRVRTNSHVDVLHTCQRPTAGNIENTFPKQSSMHFSSIREMGWNDGYLVLRLTFIVLSPDADTIYFPSKSTTFTAARWPTRTRLKLISVGDCMSQTAMDRSCKHASTFQYFLLFILPFLQCLLPQRDSFQH